MQITIDATENLKTMFLEAGGARDAKPVLMGKESFSSMYLKKFNVETELNTTKEIYICEPKREDDKRTLRCEALTFRSKNTPCLSCDCPGEK